MNRQILLALCTMIWLSGVVLLVSCTTSPLSEAPPPEEQDSLSPERALRSQEQDSLSQERALRSMEQASSEQHSLSPERALRSQERVLRSMEQASSEQASLSPWRSLRIMGPVSSDWASEPLDSVSESLDLGSESFEEEIWVIAKASPVPSLDEDAPDPGSGAMVANIPSEDEAEETEQVPLPLQHTAVDASVAGHISTVQVKQQFANPFDTKIEAVYVFPLPEKAAVTEFLMVIGERTIRGILREKAEAEAIYRAARDQGYQASLLVQHRPNIFEQKVANIEPGMAIDVDITYFHTLAYRDGWYSFVFPTVVGPRYNPPGHPDPIHALPRGGHPETPGAPAVEYLAPAERSGHDLGISVRIDAGVRIEELKSTHEIDVKRDGPASAAVQLAERTTIPNRDFVLDFRIAGNSVKSNLMTYKDPDSGEGFFSLMVIPPINTALVSRRPMEMVFVIDCSGSMDGRPLAQAKEAIATALGLLNPDDTFQIIRFSDGASQFGRKPVPATEENLAAARRYLANLNSQGGTRMLEGVKAALDFPHDPSHFRFVSFLTDGYIGNESDILAEVHRRLGAARIFSFGIGDSVNRYLLERMAKTGRGAAAYLGLDDSAEAVMGAFFERVSHAALTDVDIDWGGMTVSDTYPSQLPDLFVGRPLVVSGRFRGEPTPVTISGTVDGSRRAFVLEAAEQGSAGPSLAKVWARANIADLSDRQAIPRGPAWRAW